MANSKQDVEKNPTLIKSALRAWLLPVLALLAVGVLLVVYEADYLFKVQELNLFLYTPLFFKQQMVVSGGFLTWLGTYFTQFFYHPAIGVMLLCLWLALMMWLFKRAFRIADRHNALLLIPLALVVITNVDLGYWIYYLKFRGHFFATVIGFCVALSAVWAYRSLPSRWYLRTLWIPVSTAVLYPLVGVYSLIAAVTVAAMSLVVNKSEMAKTADAVVALLSLVAVPLIYYRTLFVQTSLGNIWFTGMPLFYTDVSHTAYYAPWILMTLLMIVLALGVSKPSDYNVPRKPKYPILGTAGLFVYVCLVCLAMWHFWYKDKNFHREIAMYQCIDNCDWEGVLNIYRDMEPEEEPTRMMWMMKNLALTRLGRAGNEMFKFKNGDAKCQAPFDVRLTQTGGKQIYYNYGKINFCYRWCLEDGVEYGWRVDFLKYLLKCSILNGEMEAAQKYADILKTTKYYGPYAEKYERYIKNPKLAGTDPEFKVIRHYMTGSDVLTSDNTLVEIYLLNEFANEDSSDPLYQEQTLLAALQQKDIQMFWPRFFHYAQIHQGEPMPVHYQEAAYLYGHLENQVDISAMPFDEEVKANYEGFMAMAQQNAGLTEEQLKPIMYPLYGGTFYYEYFLIRNQKSY